MNCSKLKIGDHVLHSKRGYGQVIKINLDENDFQVDFVYSIGKYDLKSEFFSKVKIEKIEE